MPENSLSCTEAAGLATAVGRNMAEIWTNAWSQADPAASPGELSSVESFTAQPPPGGDGGHEGELLSA